MLSFKKKCDSKVEFLSKRNVIQKNAFFQKEAWLGKVVSLKEKRAWVTANSVCCRRCLVVVVMFWMGWYWCCCCLQENPKGSTFTVESHSEKPVFFFRFSQLWHRISSACQPNITFAVTTALMSIPMRSQDTLPVITFVFKVLRNGLLRCILDTCSDLS